MEIEKKNQLKKEDDYENKNKKIIQIIEKENTGLFIIFKMYFLLELFIL
jgi:hypothetical protein